MVAPVFLSCRLATSIVSTMLLADARNAVRKKNSLLPEYNRGLYREQLQNRHGDYAEVLRSIRPEDGTTGTPVRF